MENSAIGWLHPPKALPGNTLNYWIGCNEAGPGCDGCYARVLDFRYQYGVDPETAKQNRAAGVSPNWEGTRRHRTSLALRRKAYAWNEHARSHGRPTLVFSLSLGDFFDNRVPQEWREEAYEIWRETPHLRHIIFTKRVPNISKMLPSDWGDGYRNVGLYATVCDQEEIDRDAPRLLATPARWHGFSIEPQLGRINLPGSCYAHRGSIHVITGGESMQNVQQCTGCGRFSSFFKEPRASCSRCDGALIVREPRAYDLSWPRVLIVDGAKADHLHVFVKQLGARPVVRIGINPESAPPRPVYMHDKTAGADPSEWSEDLRVRQYPPEVLS